MEKLVALSDDFDEIIPIIEKSLNIKFGNNDLLNVETFGDLCNAIRLKLNRIDSNDCTSQQAFYLIREAICKIKSIDKQTIKPSTLIIDIFEKDNIRKDFDNISKVIGIELSYFHPNRFLSVILIIFILIFFIVIFIKPLIGIIGLITTFLIIKMVFRFAKNFDFRTVGELADRIATYNYAQSRRFTNTINIVEIDRKISKIITEKLGIDGELKYSTKFELK